MEVHHHSHTSDLLLSEDMITFNELLTSAGYFLGALSLNDNVAAVRKKAALRLIDQIKKGYKLK